MQRGDGHEVAAAGSDGGDGELAGAGELVGLVRPMRRIAPTVSMFVVVPRLNRPGIVSGS